jgi:hypothetical protein
MRLSRAVLSPRGVTAASSAVHSWIPPDRPRVTETGPCEQVRLDVPMPVLLACRSVGGSRMLADTADIRARVIDRSETSAAAEAVTKMPHRRPLLPAVGFVLVSASCGMSPAATNPAQQSGSTALIFGVVEASPGCPVERQDRACKPRLLGGVRVEARPLAAGTTATTRTGAGGRYSFRLANGRYVLVAATGQVVSHLRLGHITGTRSCQYQLR